MVCYLLKITCSDIFAVILAAADPNQCGYMADECLLAIPEIEGIDYTTKALLNFVEQLRVAANRFVPSCKLIFILFCFLKFTV